MPRARHAALLTFALTLATTHAAPAQDGGHEWPEGSAMQSMQLESERLDAGLAALERAHGNLMAALGGNEPGSQRALARAVATHHEKWLAYAQADCELAGTLTGAGTSWPIVHGLGCHAQAVEQRLATIQGATACLQQMDTELSDFERLECLQELVSSRPDPAADPPA